MPQPTTGIFLNQSNPAATGGDQTVIFQTDNAQPQQSVTAVPKRATLDLFGTVKPDGTTLQIGPDGTLFAVAGSGGGGGGGGTTGTTLVREDLTSFIDGSTQDFPLSFTPTGGVDIVFYNGVGLYPYDSSYSILGSTLHLNFAPVVSPVQDRLWILYSPSSGTTPTPPPPDPTPLAFRGTGSGAATSGSSITVPWPSGTVVGDFVVIFAASGFTPSAPAGWTTSYGGTPFLNWGAVVCSKVLTSGDIAAGSVAVPVSGSFNNTYEIVAFIGPTNGIREADGLNDSGSTSAITTSSAVTAGDFAIYFGSARSDATNVCTVDRGVLQQQASDGSIGSSCLYTESIASSGTVMTANFNYSDGSIASQQAIVIVKP
ncbi:MAG TPA: hypothetical protein VK638_24945 [Edaphobacter sp.]|nr:hypothetical protein [Edaphobacter sp.]